MDDVLSTATKAPKTKGRSTIYEKTGGSNQATADFNSLNPSNVKNIPNGKVGTLEGEKKVIVRTKSSDGRSTLEVQKGKNKTKIRYND